MEREDHIERLRRELDRIGRQGNLARTHTDERQRKDADRKWVEGVVDVLKGILDLLETSAERNASDDYGDFVTEEDLRLPTPWPSATKDTHQHLEEIHEYQQSDDDTDPGFAIHSRLHSDPDHDPGHSHDG